MADQSNPLLTPGALSVINLGAELFAEALRQQEVPVVQVQWTPPAAQDEDLLDLLDNLL